MSNIINNSNTLLMLSDDLRHLNNHDITKSFVEELLKQMILANNMQELVNYIVADSSFGEGSVLFDPNEEKIEIYLGKLNYWLEDGINVLMKDYNLKDKEDLKSYALIAIIAHEIEHAYQYFSGIGLINSPNSTISFAYEGIYSMLKRDDPERNKIYCANFKKLLLERNAQIECIDLILNLAKYNGRLDIYDAFKQLSDEWALIGYKDNSDGSIRETYRLLNLYDKHLQLGFEIEMSEEDRIRYGYPILDVTRQRILEKK